MAYHTLSRVWSPYSAFPVPPRPERAITTQGADLRAWLRQHQDPRHLMSTEKLKYAARTLSVAQLGIAHLRPLHVVELIRFGPVQVSNTSLFCQFWNSNQSFGLEIMFLRRNEEHASSRWYEAVQHVQIFHATSPGGLRGILTEAKLQPFKLHQADSCSFFWH